MPKPWKWSDYENPPRTYRGRLQVGVEAIKFRMEQGGLTSRDLEPMIGKRNRVYEVLSRKRNLTLPILWRLHKELGIPAESLIRSMVHA